MSHGHVVQFVGQLVEAEPTSHYVACMSIDPELLKFATDEDLEELEYELKLQEALRSPLDFAVYVSGAERYPHLVYLNDLLVAMFKHRLYKSGIGPVAVMVSPRKWVHPVTGEKCLTQIAISMPPRHGKSFLVSEHMPAWWSICNPEQPVILTSYEADFAAGWGEKARNHIEEHPEFEVFVDKEARSKSNWRLKGHRGGMATAGTGGPITGKGAGLLGMDDPIKNAEEALSAVERETADGWYQSTWRTRGNNKGNTGHFKFMMYTRWHEDDIGGRVLSREGDDWYVVNLPALAWDATDEDGISIDPETGERDPLGRRPGEALCPDLATAEELRQLQEGGRQWFSAMYQGKPNIQGGGIFSREGFRFYKKNDSNYELTDEHGASVHVPESEVMVRYAVCDTAATDKTRSDYTSVGVYVVTRDHKLIVEAMYRKKLEAPDHEEFVREIYKRHKCRFLGVEDQTYGKSLIQHLIRGGGIVVRKLKADRDKVSRAIPAGMNVANGLVYVPRDAEWVEAFIDELCKFPNAKHDDQVDNFAYAIYIWERVPKYRPPKMVDNSMQARLDRHLAQQDKKKSKRWSPDLGHW